MPAAKRRRTPTQIHGHVEHLALDHPHQLALRIRILKMQSAQRAAPRRRQVVLYESHGQSGLTVTRLVPQLHEKATRIAEHLRLDDQQSGDVTTSYFHERLRASAMTSFSTYSRYSHLGVRVPVHLN